MYKLFRHSFYEPYGSYTERMPKAVTATPAKLSDRPQEDMLYSNVERAAIEKVSALGATFLVRLATGFWKNLEEISLLRKAGKILFPEMEEKEINKLNADWKKAIERARL